MAQKRSNLMTIRLTNAGFLTVEKLAVEFGLPRTVVARQMMVVAAGHERELRAGLTTLAQEVKV